MAKTSFRSNLQVFSWYLLVTAMILIPILMYSGRDKNVELPEFARELFTIVKKMFLLKTATLPEKIGALFLMYSLYYKQENL